MLQLLVRYHSDVSTSDISQYQYQPDIGMLQIIRTFQGCFVVWSLRKTASSDITQKRMIVGNVTTGFLVEKSGLLSFGEFICVILDKI